VASYDRLVDDAGESPVTQAGSRDQFGIRFGVTRTIRLGF
jgi:MipA family protein